MADAVGKDEFKSLKKQLQELRQRELEREEAEEKIKLEKSSEAEKEKILRDKELKKIKADLEEQINQLKNTDKKRQEEILKERSVNLILRGKALESEILVSADKNKALRPSQIVRLLKEDFTWDDTQNKFVYIEKDERGKVVDYIDVEDYVKSFLEKEENDNLVKSDVKPNSLNSPRGGTDKGKDLGVSSLQDKKYKPTGDYDPKDPALIKEADHAGMPVEKWIRVKEMRDSRMKIKQERMNNMRK
jgi:hypothetical protein